MTQLLTSPLASEISNLTGITIPDTSLFFTRWITGTGLLPEPAAVGCPDPVSEPGSCFTYLDNRRKTIIDSCKQRPRIRVMDGNLNAAADLVGELSCTTEELVADTGHTVCTIRYDNWIADWMIHQTRDVEDLHLIIDPFPTKPDWRTRWAGKINEIHVKHDEQGKHTIEIHALSFREHLKRLLYVANPIFPPELNLPRMWVLPGPTRSICAITTFINLMRIFNPALSIPTNLLNPAGWINPLGPDALLNFDPMMMPIQVAFVDTVLDTSRWESIGASYNDAHTAIKDILTDAGCIARVYCFLKDEDPDSPHTELTDILSAGLDLLSIFGVSTPEELSNLLGPGGIPGLTRPGRNCAVISFEDKSGVTGPTGTAADGGIQLAAVTLDDLITPIMVNPATGDVLDPGNTLNGEPIEDASGIDRTYLFEQLTMTAPGPPVVIFWEGTYRGISNSDLTWHKGPVKTIFTGGKSPTIVNEAQTFMIRYALAQLSAVINYAIGAYQQSGTPGLDNLYQGQLDNTLFAYEKFTDPIRALWTGDLAWNEHFEKGSGTAYVLASVLTLRSGDFKTRAYASFKVQSTVGPWLPDIDFVLGDRVGFEEEFTIYVDQCTAIKREWAWDKALAVTMNIGDDRDRDDPFAAAFKTMAGIWGLLGEFLGQGTLFG